MDFQTPEYICKYMVALIPNNCKSFLEPTAGEGNIINQLKMNGYNDITFPKDFFKMDFNKRFDCIIMNPPFTPMNKGYEILFKCMEMSDNIIALMPWLTIINSTKRLNKIKEYGLVEITHLPRNVFKGSRVQTCILKMQKEYNKNIEFKIYG
jgi:type I restriction-modification system DNA methylase subunit